MNIEGCSIAMKKHGKEVHMKIRKILAYMVLVPVCFAVLGAAGCEGSDAKKSITDTVRTVMGDEVIHKGQEVRGKIDQAMKDEAKRLLKSGEQKNGDAPEDGSKDGAEGQSDQ
jgi:hypothetical protein